jgi:hypothetical protein
VLLVIPSSSRILLLYSESGSLALIVLQLARTVVADKIANATNAFFMNLFAIADSSNRPVARSVLSIAAGVADRAGFRD